MTQDGANDRPRELGRLVAGLIRRRGLAERSASGRLREVWEQAAGREMAARSTAHRVNGRVLEVVVSNSAALEQMRSFMHDNILAEVRRLLPESDIQNIRYLRRR